MKQLQKRLSNSKILILVIILIFPLFAIAINNQKCKRKKKKHKIVKTDSLPTARIIYHDNPRTKEDSLRMETAIEKENIAFMLFYKSRLQPEQKTIDSMYQSGYRVDSTEFSKAYYNYAKEKK